MDAQDEINDILVEFYPTNIKRSLGGLCYNGAMHMIDNYPSAIDEIDTWTYFGDPSLQIRTDTPSSMSVTHSATIPDGATSFEVTVTGLENALCALSQNGELLGYDYTDATGYAYLTLTGPVSGPDPLDLVVTAYNKFPYITTVLTGDDSPPSITNIAHTPHGQIMGGYVNVSCQVTDSGGVDGHKLRDDGAFRHGRGRQEDEEQPSNGQATVSAKRLEHEESRGSLTCFVVGGFVTREQRRDSRGRSCR